MRGKSLIGVLAALLGLLVVALLWRATSSSAKTAARAPASPAPSSSEPPRPAPLPPVPPPVRAPAPAPGAPSVAKAPPRLPPPPADEPQLMEQLRAVAARDPAQAITLAREGQRRFGEAPDSEPAAERAAVIIHALVATDQASEARGEAERMVNHYAVTSPWVRDVERFTGAHPHRDVHVNDAGGLEYR